MIFTLSAFVTALMITSLAIPSIIKVAQLKHLYDVPDERKSHKINVPTLGGLAIFAGLIFSVTFWSTQKDIVELQYIIASIMILFFLGMKDDLYNLVAYKKLIGQVVAALIIVHYANIRITSFFGIFGVKYLALWASYLFSMFTIIVITNSINLIDGIDCLAGTVGFVASVLFGSWFFVANQTQYTILAFSLCGALLGFLYYNRTPAKIFMGDTGSLIVGLVLSILSIKFIEMNRVMSLDAPHKIRRVPVVTIAILIVPLFDTLRAFILRMLQGKSPFLPDRNHLHHLLLDIGYTHIKATAILTMFNIFAVIAVYAVSGLKSELILAALLSTCLLCSYYLAHLRLKRRTKNVVVISRDSQKDISKVK